MQMGNSTTAAVDVTGQPRTQPAQIIGKFKPRLKISKCECSHATGPTGGSLPLLRVNKIVKINNAPLSILNDFVKPSKKEKK